MVDPATIIVGVEVLKEVIAYGTELYERWGDESYTPPPPDALNALAAQIEALPPLPEE
jgi:hypothetical protein